MSSSHCCFLTCIQISQEAGQVVWYSHLSQNFPQFIVIHIVKGFGIVNKAEIDVFLELSFFCHDPADVGNLISGSSAFSKASLNIWKFTVYVLLKPDLENFEHYFTSMWDECNCEVVWAFFCIAFLWDWNENWHFSVLWPLLSFPNLLTYSVLFSSVQLLSHVRLFATPWNTARQASLSITNFRSSLRLTSIESVMPSSHLILYPPLLLLPPIPPSIRFSSNESTLSMRWPKYWSFSFSILHGK